jgi:signal transduction histidine kinase
VVASAREAWPNATITAAIETELPVATGAEIRDALENLVENAVVHNTTNPSVRVTAERRDPVAIVTVEDNGPGIPQNERAVVFNDENKTSTAVGNETHVKYRADGLVATWHSG